MTNFPVDNLKKLGITLPAPPAAIAAYVPFVVSGNMVVISGQLPIKDGAVAFKGKLGDSVSITTGAEAARCSAINVLAQLHAAVGGDWARVQRVVRLGGFIACTPDFSEHPKVMNGASELIVAVLGEAGRHARTTIGVPSLPLDACCEVEAWVEVR